MKKYLCILLSIFFLAACQNKQQEPQPVAQGLEAEQAAANNTQQNDTGAAAKGDVLADALADAPCDGHKKAEKKDHAECDGGKDHKLAKADAPCGGHEAKKDHGSCDGGSDKKLAQNDGPADCTTLGEKDDGLPAPLVAGDHKEFGAKLELAGEPTPLKKAVENLKSTEGQKIKIVATVDKVCSTKGCWMTFKDEGLDKTVRVRMKGHSFFVPRNSDGAIAVAEGQLSERRIPKELLQHYASETEGEKHKKIEQDGFEYTFIAEGVELTMPKT